jgi:hypothetical protein
MLLFIEKSIMESVIKLITYNIDGLPEYLDLKTLPWILRPVSWIYKLIKGTTLISINDNSNISKCIKYISKWLYDSDADIISVQEDFNYLTELMGSLNGKYLAGTHTGGIEFQKLFSKIECHTHFPLPRFKTDGIELIFKKNRINVVRENIIEWNDSYGYFNHANDLLIHKGFRFYQLLIYGKIGLDLYIIHMDADFYDEEKCPNVYGDIKARESQLKQLAEFIEDRYKIYRDNNPAIIMGDTNSHERYIWDVNNLNGYLIYPINITPHLSINEAVPTNFNDVDRMFYINHDKSKYKIEFVNCYYGENTNEDVGRLSDHRPFISTFILKKR